MLVSNNDDYLRFNDCSQYMALNSTMVAGGVAIRGAIRMLPETI